MKKKKTKDEKEKHTMSSLILYNMKYNRKLNAGVKINRIEALKNNNKLMYGLKSTDMKAWCVYVCVLVCVCVCVCIYVHVCIMYLCMWCK